MKDVPYLFALAVLIAATLQGAIFALITTAVNRYGIKAYRRFLNSKG